jgi:hypothetical protein
MIAKRKGFGVPATADTGQKNPIVPVRLPAELLDSIAKSMEEGGYPKTGRSFWFQEAVFTFSEHIQSLDHEDLRNFLHSYHIQKGNLVPIQITMRGKYIEALNRLCHVAEQLAPRITRTDLLFIAAHLRLIKEGRL